MGNTLKNMKKQRGITLIALVVTIIVLLILAGVTINLVLADGGIFSKAEQAEEAQKKAEVTDLVSIMLSDAKIEKMVYKRDVLDFLTEKQKDGKLDSVTDNGDGTITIEKNGYTFIIDEKTTKILEISENTRTVRIALDKTVAKLNEEVTATITIIGSDIKEVLKWEYNATSIDIGESNYTNEYTSNKIKLSQATEGTYYLHLLVEDKSGNKEEKISVAIKVMPNPVESITLDKTTIEIEKGTTTTTTITATVLPNDATNKTLAWKSSDETVATVVSTGDNTAEITALTAGNTKITAEATDGSEVKSEECTVTVIQKVETISLSETTATVGIGKTKILTATITPEDATNKELTWTSSATSVATVDNTGKITGVATGTATITVKATDGSGKTATCTVTVVEADSDWELLSEIAEEISNDSTITKASATATVKVDNIEHTLKVGDTYKVRVEDGTLKTVRIIGFNHDKLTSASAYGGNNTYAGISFEFVDLITSAKMNSSITNSGGWGSSALRSTLNNTTVTTLRITGVTVSPVDCLVA